MIALDEVHADLKLAAAGSDIVDASVLGGGLLRPGLPAQPGADDGHTYGGTGRYKNGSTLARECLDLIGYPRVICPTHPPRIEATQVKIDPRFEHEHAAALWFFNAFGMVPETGFPPETAAATRNLRGCFVRAGGGLGAENRGAL